jgi:hypothetical protein
MWRQRAPAWLRARMRLMLSKNVRNGVAVFSDVAGVLGFLLALLLGVITWNGYRISLIPDLRLGALDESTVAPFVDIPQAELGGQPAITFTIHHDRGRQIQVDAVCLKFRLAPQSSAGWHTVGGFGVGGTFEVRDNAEYRYCQRVAADGSLMASEAAALPFSQGDTRFYAISTAALVHGGMAHQTDSTHFASLEVWSQGRVVASFDVSVLARKLAVQDESMSP